MKAAIIYGSPSDTEVMKKAAGVFREMGVAQTAHILSAHRNPELLREIVERVEREGAEVIVAGAGLAAHLPGVIASLTTLPVIGVPIGAGTLGGLDALLSMAQMPRPIPVATVGIDNAANGAFLACEILALKYEPLREKLIAYRTKLKISAQKDGEGVEL